MISPSMMCIDYTKFSETLETFKRNNIEYLHIDIMDGVFVPNYTIGPDFVKALRNNSDIPMDYHFMVESPEKCLDWFDIKENDIVSIHVESTKHIEKVLSSIKNKGAKAFVALNPGTPICFLDEILDDIDGVLVMSVNPGFAGQKMVPHSIDKIKKVREYLDLNNKKDALIEVDGNVSFVNARLMSDAGANIFVGGTSSIFKGNMEENILKLRESVK